MTNIYEPQGISYVDAHATFLSNELLPLVQSTVTDKKVHDTKGLIESCLPCVPDSQLFLSSQNDLGVCFFSSDQTVSHHQAHISFSPSMEQQRKCPGCDGTLIDGDFIINYDVNREKGLGNIQVSCTLYLLNAHFIHMQN